MLAPIFRLSRLIAGSAGHLPGAARAIAGLRRALVWRAIEAALIAGAAMLLYPALTAAFADTIELGRIALLTGGIALCLGLRTVLFHHSGLAIFEGVYSLTGALRLRIADHLRRLPAGAFGRDRLAHLRTVMTQDLRTIGQTAGSLLGFLVTATALPLLLLAGLAVIDWRLSAAIALGTGLSLPVLWLFNRFIAVHGARHFDSIAGASTRLIEYVLGIKVLKSYGLTGARFKRLEEAVEHQKKTALALEYGAIAMMWIANLIVELGLPLLLTAGSWWLIAGTLPLPVLMFALILSVRMQEPLQNALSLIAEFTYLDTALARVEDVLSVPAQAEPQAPQRPDGHEIVFDRVAFRYEADAPLALEDISFTAKPGSVVALVGPSGAGKSTIAMLAARFHDPSAGAVSLGGVPLTGMAVSDLMDRVALVFQDVVLFNDTIAENIRLARPDADDAAVIAAAKAACCHDFIMAMPEGYDTRIGEGGGRLSGGERQRLSIARALLKDAPILVLDEATAAVDPTAERAIRQALLSLAGQRTILVIAHRLNTITHADEILVVDEGRIVERGRHEALLAEGGLYRRLWDGQAEAEGGTRRLAA